MKITIIFLDVLLCMFRVYMLWDLERNILPQRTTKKQVYWCINLLCVGILWGISMLSNSVLNLIFVPLVYLFFSYVNFQGQLIKKLVISLCYYLLAIAPEFVFAVFISWDPAADYQVLQANQLGRWILSLLLKTATFFLVKLVNYLHKRKDYSEIVNKVFISLLILPTATITVFISIYYSNIQSSDLMRIFLVIGALLLVFANAFTFFQLDKVIEQESKARNLEMLYNKSKIEISSLRYIEELNEQHRLLLHDIHKHIRTAGSLMAEEENQEVIAILAQLGGKITASKENVYSQNNILNAILGERKIEAERLMLSFQADIASNVSVDFIKEVDLISILGNLLDNAIEAAAEVNEQGKVEIQIYQSEHFLMIEVVNNYLNVPVKGKKNYLTRKSDKQMHGLGLLVVQQLAEKYDGRFVTSAVDSVFKASVALSQHWNDKELKK